MKPIHSLLMGSALSLISLAPVTVHAQDPSPPEASQPVIDPATVSWPRTFTVDSEDYAVFQPQISTWTGNQIKGRFAWSRSRISRSNRWISRPRLTSKPPI